MGSMFLCRQFQGKSTMCNTKLKWKQSAGRVFNDQRVSVGPAMDLELLGEKRIPKRMAELNGLTGP